MKPEYFVIAALLASPVALVLLMYALHWALDKWGYPSALRAFKALGLPADIEAAAIACFDDARARQRKTWWFDILPALKDGDSHNWRHMSVPGKDI